MDLITDRTSRDVARWEMLRNKGWNCMTEMERREWLGEILPTPAASKGMYTHNDLNRVEGVVKTLIVRLKAMGYKVPDLVVKTDWTHRDTVWSDDMARYYSNIETLRNVLTVYPSTPEAPKVDKKLDFNTANDIEQILLDICSLLAKQSKSWYYVGEIFTGEV